MKINNFDILKKMSKDGKDISGFFTGNIESINKRGKKETDFGFVKIAVDNTTCGKLLGSMISKTQPPFSACLLVFSLNDYNEIKAELEKEAQP